MRAQTVRNKSILVAAIGLALGIPAFGQTPTINAVKISAIDQSGNLIKGAWFTVDGQSFETSVEQLWTANTKHVVSGFDQTPSLAPTRLHYIGYITNLGSTP